MLHIIIPIDDAPVDELKHYLLAYLPEVEHAESFAHRLMERIGF